MTIGIDARLWNETGVGRYIRNLVRNLQVLDKKNKYILFVLENDYQRISEEINSKHITVVPVNIRWHSLEEQVKFPHILNRYSLDLMHFPYFSVPMFYTRPYVVTIHDLIIYHFATGKASTLPLPMYAIKQAGYRMVIKQAVKNAQHIIVPLETTKDDVVKTLTVDSERITVTKEGFDESIVANKNTRPQSVTYGKKYFLYVGNAYPHKNVYHLIESFRTFQKQTSETIDLVLVGKNDYFYQQIENFVAKEKIKNVHFLHDVSDNELAYLYNHATALFAPSLLEGFGLPPLEAMASSCLVVASNIPAFHEVCADAAMYFSIQDKEHLAKVMHDVLSLPKKEKDQYLEKGKARVRTFSWKAMAQQTLTIYESCIGVRSRK